MDPSRTFDFNDLEEGLTFQGDIVEVVGERDSTENQETDDVSHTLKIDYKKYKENTTIPLIHIFHEPWRCSIIVGEYMPDIMDLLGGSWFDLAIPKWKVGLGSEGNYCGLLKEKRTAFSDPVRLESERSVNLSIQAPNIKIGHVFFKDNVKYFHESNVYTIPIDPDYFDLTNFSTSNCWYFCAELPVIQYFNVDDYPNSFQIKITMLEGVERIQTSPEFLSQRTITLEKVSSDCSFVKYLSCDEDKLLFISEKDADDDGIYDFYLPNQEIKQLIITDRFSFCLGEE